MPTITTMLVPVHACGCKGRPQRDTEAGRAMVAAFALTECFTCQRVNAGMQARQMMTTLQLPELDGKREPNLKTGVSQYDYSIVVREQVRQRIEAAYPAPEPVDIKCADAVLYGITDSSWWLDRKDAEPYTILSWVKPIVDIIEARLS